MGWKKGQSGNPKGRPPIGTPISDEVRKLLDLRDVEIKSGRKKIKISRSEAVAQVLVRQAINGNPHALKLLLSYIDGLPVQKMEHTGEGGSPIEVVFPKGFKGL